MATTHGYGGEFSSDDEIDRIEQQSERVIQSKFNDGYNVRPSADEIEQTIEAIRKSSAGDSFKINDELLAGLLDYFKIHRGPIVDSTRKLYTKLVLKMIQEQHSNGSAGTNGKTIHDNFNNNNNNNVIDDNDLDAALKSRKPEVAIDSFSSDEEEPLAPHVRTALKKRTEETSNKKQTKLDDDVVEAMEVDSETPKGQVRDTKQVDINTDEEDNSADDSESSDESEGNEMNSKSDVLEVTPIKPSKGIILALNERQRSTDVSSAVTPVTLRQAAAESASVKRQPLAHSTPKESISGTAKKPYTRSSRRLAETKTPAANSHDSTTDSFIETKTAATSSNDGKRLFRRSFLLIPAALMFVLIAFLVYKYRESISEKIPTSSRAFGTTINFS